MIDLIELFFKTELFKLPCNFFDFAKGTSVTVPLLVVILSYVFCVVTIIFGTLKVMDAAEEGIPFSSFLMPKSSLPKGSLVNWFLHNSMFRIFVSIDLFLLLYGLYTL